MSLSSLPEEVLVLMMENLSLKDRLGSCCRVSRRLHAAAVAATQDITGRQPPDIWIFKYGHYLTHLQLEGYQRRLRLACPNLRSLRLQDGSVQLGAAVGWPGVLQGCTSLTYLNLWCSIIDAPYGALVGSLLSLVHLQHLELMPGRDIAGLSPSTLPRLQHLTYLKVKCLSDANLYQLGALTSLQELHLWVWDDPADSHLAASSLAGLVLPASLKKLSLESEVGAELLSVAPAGLQHLMVNCGVYGLAEEPESFLSCIGRLQHLTALSLNPGRYFAWLPAGPAYSALTASSDLVRLEMTGYGFPSGLWSHVFVTTRKLPQLTSLSLTVFTKPNWGGKEPIEFCAGDLSRLVSSCPSLSHIGTLCLQPRLYVSELHKLSALTSLRVYFESVGPDSFGESMRGLAAVTQLQKLRLIKSAGLTVASLLPLTSLTTLTRLQLEKGLDDGARISLAYTSNAQGGSPPDVWQQLLECCIAEADS